MPVTAATDILLRDMPDHVQFRKAVARAFGLPTGLVTVSDAEGTDQIPDEVRVLILRQPLTMPGDFPAWYHLSIDPQLIGQIDPAFDMIARTLGTVILTDADDYFGMTLHLPDGTGQVVELSQGDDDAFRVTSGIRQLIEQATRQTVAS